MEAVISKLFERTKIQDVYEIDTAKISVRFPETNRSNCRIEDSADYGPLKPLCNQPVVVIVDRDVHLAMGLPTLDFPVVFLVLEREPPPAKLDPSSYVGFPVDPTVALKELGEITQCFVQHFPE